MQEKYEFIKKECLKSVTTDPIKLIFDIMQTDYINIHGPEHHILDGSCFLTAMHNAGVKFDLEAALDEMIVRGQKMPGAICGQWGVCGSSASVGAALAILHETGPLSNNQYYKDNLNYVSKALEKIAQVGGPRCCKRNAFLSLLTAIDFVKEQYGVKLETHEVSCIFSEENAQCLKTKCPFFAQKNGDKDSIGTSQPIPKEVRESMRGISMPEGAKVAFEELSYLEIPHYDFSGERAIGHMVVNKKVAEEVLLIFQELYEMKYPIERMELIDNFAPFISEEFPTLDDASMGKNNSSSFCYRVIAGTDKISNHAYGTAIDINPLINPWVSNVKENIFTPSNAEPYLNREPNFEDEVINRALLHHGDAVYKVFEKYGWLWGGDWENKKDYQHFYKEIVR